ncbi:DUF4397 domain-containing protein [Silvibacterium acidisoli]|uniref:DUF4397 domain-containing protein n=1 Tax=Acidobacteriaceae bacterium ZG23-2 TaxID=2883246 RepID=UPI00406C76D6
MLASATLFLSGCENVANSSHPVTLVRMIDASYQGHAYDAYQGSTPIAVNFAGPSVGSYAYLSPGATTIKIVPTGKPQTTVTSVTGTFTASEQHSVYITDSNGGITAQVLTDQNAAGPGGDVSLRFLQQATGAGNLDIYLAADGSLPVVTGTTALDLSKAKPLLSSEAAGSVSSYYNVPPGTYDVIVVPSGATDTSAGYVSSATALTAGQVRTLLIVDQQLLATPPVSVITADDYN